MGYKMKYILSSPSWFWLWCFIIATETATEINIVALSQGTPRFRQVWEALDYIQIFETSRELFTGIFLSFHFVFSKQLCLWIDSVWFYTCILTFTQSDTTNLRHAGDRHVLSICLYGLPTLQSLVDAFLITLCLVMGPEKGMITVGLHFPYRTPVRTLGFLIWTDGAHNS